MHGTLVNAATVAAGTAVGVAGGQRLPERIRGAVTDGLGLFTLALGARGSLRAFERGRLADAVVVLVGLLVGGLAGTAFDVEGRLERLGARVGRRAGASAGGFAQGFLTASLVFCVGPLTVLGALRDGVHGDASLLTIKAVLDGFAAVALAATYGPGVGASVLTILVYQGGLTLAASGARGLFTPGVLRALDAVGGLLILGIGLRLLGVRDVRVGNFLPALVLVPAGAALLR